MRLIDANAVSAILTRLIEEQKKSHNLDEVIGLMEAKTEVNNAPTVPQWINAYGMQTIDTAPVIHAHWIEYRTNSGNVHYICSHCGKDVSYAYAGKRWKFCINCGAKMDEE